MTLIAIDPGPHTGTFSWRVDHAESLTLDLETAVLDIFGMTQHRYLWDWLVDHIRKGDEIICEKFEFQKDKRDRENLNYDAGEYVGVIKLYCAMSQTPIHMQSPSQVVSKSQTNFWNDDKLKRVGLWKGMTRHERDAARHYLYYVTFTLGDQTWLNKLKLK